MPMENPFDLDSQDLTWADVLEHYTEELPRLGRELPEYRLYQNIKSRTLGGPESGVDDVVGAAIQLAGGAMLLPGPTYSAAAIAGVAVFKHPVGALAGIVAYAALGVGVHATGTAARGID